MVYVGHCGLTDLYMAHDSVVLIIILNVLLLHVFTQPPLLTPEFHWQWSHTP